MSSPKESEEHTSPPATPLSRGVHVASSHFSKIRASSGNKGCLEEERGGGRRRERSKRRSRIKSSTTFVNKVLNIFIQNRSFDTFRSMLEWLINAVNNYVITIISIITA